MSDPALNRGLDANEMLAERVRQQLTVFPDKFAELGEGGELRRLLTTPHTLRGPIVDQAREDFTEQYLIEPILHSLGFWNPISEKYDGKDPHFVRRPSTFRKIEINRPDYLLKNVSPEMVCILEAKAANEERPTGNKRKATDDLREYVESNTFSKYLKSREQRFLVAIGTDGLRWVLWAKDVREDTNREAIAEVDLSDAVASVARKHSVIEGDSDMESVEIRRYITAEFIPAFSARCIPKYVREHFDTGVN
jgi:hypothetical protein